MRDIFFSNILFYLLCMLRILINVKTFGFKVNRRSKTVCGKRREIDFCDYAKTEERAVIWNLRWN